MKVNMYEIIMEMFYKTQFKHITVLTKEYKCQSNGSSGSCSACRSVSSQELDSLFSPVLPDAASVPLGNCFGEQPHVSVCKPSCGAPHPLKQLSVLRQHRTQINQCERRYRQE